MCVVAASQSSWPIALCTPRSTWLHPWCGAELELPHFSVLDYLIPPNQSRCYPPGCFNPGGTSPELVLVLWWPLQSLCCSGTHAAGCGPPEARWQWDARKKQVGGKVLVCKLTISNPIPLGFCPGSRFYRLLPNCARIPQPHCQRQWDGVELDFFFFFIQICIAKSRTS